jgi:hypothetical protein
MMIIFVKGVVDRSAVMQPEGLSFEKSHDHIESRTDDLPARSIVPQRTTREHFVLFLAPRV